MMAPITTLLMVGVIVKVGWAWAAKKGELTSAGVWVDDGRGHTVREELPAEEAKVLKQHMLDVLGLPEPPRRRRHGHVTYGSAPIFLRSIYDALDERGNARNAHTLDPQHRITVGKADTIITFVNKKPPGFKRSHHGANHRLYFDVNDVSLDHFLLGAELRIYRSLAAEGEERQKDFSLIIYMLMNEESDETEVVRVPLHDHGWTSVNVTNSALNWIIFPKSNFGLRIAIIRNGWKHEEHLHTLGVAGARDKDVARPFLVGFFALPEHTLSRRTRSATPVSVYKDSTNRKYTEYMTMMSDAPSPSELQCRKRPLHVSFSDLGWENWVIAPEGYDANFCRGRCEFPMLANMNATNHAIVQTLVHLASAGGDPSEIPPLSCCAPRDLSTISVIFYDYSNNVVLKKYPKMIVKSCGCS